MGACWGLCRAETLSVPRPQCRVLVPRAVWGSRMAPGRCPTAPWPQPQAGSAAGRCPGDGPAAPRWARAQAPRSLSGQSPPLLEAAVGTLSSEALPKVVEESPVPRCRRSGVSSGAGRGLASPGPLQPLLHRQVLNYMSAGRREETDFKILFA